MIQLSIHLPLSRMLRIQIVKARKSGRVPLLPHWDSLNRVRKGSKFSRYFRHIIERINVRRVIGTNLAFMVLASSLLPISNTHALDVESVATGQSTIVLKTERSIRYPVKTISITQGYRFYHPGIDFDGITGDPIYPVIDGVIESAGYSQYGYGNAIIVRHTDKTTSLYAHLSKIEVSVGDAVTQDDVIGLMGATGRSFGDHLHFELHSENGIPLNPMNFLEPLK